MKMTTTHVSNIVKRRLRDVTADVSRSPRSPKVGGSRLLPELLSVGTLPVIDGTSVRDGFKTRTLKH